MTQEPPTEVFVVKSSIGHIRYAGGTHSSRGSFFLTERGAAKACWHPEDEILKGTITWGIAGDNDE